SPLPPQSLLRRDAAVVDLVYGVTTPLIIQARGAGCITMDGIEMLVQQGAASFRLWTGLQPDIGVMRTACHRQLAEVQACSAS
ncbi:MAG TPA: hypothetical protein VF221_16290, partial [Chloroflexota bacterium]